MWAYGRGQTHRRAWPQYILRRLSTTHAKCNNLCESTPVTGYIGLRMIRYTVPVASEFNVSSYKKCCCSLIFWRLQPQTLRWGFALLPWTMDPSGTGLSPHWGTSVPTPPKTDLTPHLRQSRAPLTREKGSCVKIASGTGRVARCVMARRTVARLVFGIALFYSMRL